MLFHYLKYLFNPAVYPQIAILVRLRVLDPDECGIVRWMGVFTHGPRVCLEFELLDRSLRDLTQQTERHVLPLARIRIILEQVWLG